MKEEQTTNITYDNKTLRPIGQLLKDTFSFWKAHFLKLFAISFIPYITSLTLLIILRVLGDNLFNSSSMVSSNSAVTFPIVVIYTIVAFLVGILTLPFIISSMYYGIANISASLKEIYIAASRKMVNVLGADIVVYGIYIGVALFLLSLGIILGMAANSIIGFVIPIILLVVFSIILAVKLSIRHPLLVLEGSKVFESLAESSNYIKGHGFSVFAKLFVLGIIVLVLNLIGVLLVFFADKIIGVIISAIIYIFILSFSSVYVFNIYKDLKNIKGEISSVSTGKYKISFVVGIVLTIVSILLFSSIVIGYILNYSKSIYPGMPGQINSIPSVAELAENTKRKSLLVQFMPMVSLYSIENDNRYPDDIQEMRDYLIENNYLDIIEYIDKGILKYTKKGENSFEACVKLIKEKEECRAY